MTVKDFIEQTKGIEDAIIKITDDGLWDIKIYSYDCVDEDSYVLIVPVKKD